jgi:hypothetical protein
VFVLGLATVLLSSACAESSGDRAAAPSPATSPTGVGPSAAPSWAAPPSSEPTTAAESSKETYAWAVPSNRAAIANSVPRPQALLVAVYSSEHSTEDPAYERLAFYFRGGLPSYNFNYAAEIREGEAGANLPLKGNAFLRLQFEDATTAGPSGTSVSLDRDQAVDLRNLKNYGYAGEPGKFLNYGLGIQVASGSGQVLPIRATQLRRSDGAGDFYYVVAIDVQRG